MVQVEADRIWARTAVDACLVGLELSGSRLWSTILGFGVAVLAQHSGADCPAGESTKQYVIGFLLTLVAAAMSGFLLPMVELMYKKTSTITYSLVMELQMVMCLFATIFCIVGMIVDNNFKARIKEALLIERLKRYEVPRVQGPVVKPDGLTGEERFYLKKMPQKSSNYLQVGRRGLFGGVILNMHMHWKKHETVKEAMREAEVAGNNDCPVEIKLVAPPLYVLTTQTLDKVPEFELSDY